jgi:hypothetical protein
MIILAYLVIQDVKTRQKKNTLIIFFENFPDQKLK